MTIQGGFTVRLQGRPAADIQLLPEPSSLYLPLQSRRFRFGEVCVGEGERVAPGRVLAKDTGNFSLPLLAPRAGTVRLKAAGGHLVLDDIAKAAEEPFHPDEDLDHVPKDMGSSGMKRYKLLQLGAWQFLEDAHTGELPDPFGTPRAVIVSTLHLEPFVARGDVLLNARLKNFTRGLEHLQALLEYPPIHLVLPDVESAFASKVREALRGYAFVKLFQVRRRYPYGSSNLVARALGLKREEGNPVWALDTAGVLAIDRALSLSRPSTVRIISIGGPAVRLPQHLVAIPGYPLDLILKTRLSEARARVINGGALTGTTIPPEQKGLDVECQGLTAIP